MLIIDKYISSKFIVFFILSLLVFVISFSSIDYISKLVMYTPSTISLLKYFIYYIPEIANQMLGISMLSAVIFTLSSLNKSNELMAIYSMGVSIIRINIPVICIAIIITAIFFVFNDKILPIFAKKQNYIFYTEIIKKPALLSTVKTNKIWYRSKNSIFYIRTLNPNKKIAQGLNMYNFDDDWNLIEMIHTQKVTLKKNYWELINGSITLFTKKSNFPLTQDFIRKTIVMDEDIRDLQSSTKHSNMLTLKEMKNFIDKNKKAGLNTLQYEVDYYSKFSFAFSPLIMALLGIPFSVSRKRSGGGAIKNIGKCMLIATIYWSLHNAGINLGKFGKLSPIISTWIANIFMLCLCLYFLYRTKKMKFI